VEEIAGRFDPAGMTAPEYAAAVVRGAIVVGAIRGGQPIRQDELAAILQTSKVPVREALRELQSEGLVEFIANRGFVAAQHSRAEMDEVFALRLALEPLATQLSMPMITRPDIERAEQAMREIGAITDYSWQCSLNLTLHLALYEPARTPHLIKMIRHAHHVSHRYVHLAIYDKGETFDWSQHQHAAIIAAFTVRDTPAAEQLIRDHIDHAHQDLSEILFGTPAAAR
jgi:DNA-binding GntR family transcriptional regulator